MVLCADYVTGQLADFFYSRSWSVGSHQFSKNALISVLWVTWSYSPAGRFSMSISGAFFMAIGLLMFLQLGQMLIIYTLSPKVCLLQLFKLFATVHIIVTSDA